MVARPTLPFSTILAVELFCPASTDLPSTLRFFTSASGQARLHVVRDTLSGRRPDREAIIVGATRAAADEMALAIAEQLGGLFGVTRMSYAELATKLALPSLATKGLSPTGGFGAEAFAARAAFEATANGRLTYFAPVGDLPGFPRALARTLAELRLGGVTPADLVTLGDAGRDLGELLTSVVEESRKAGAVDRAHVMTSAAEALDQDGSAVERFEVVLLDVPISTLADRRLVEAISRRARSVLATVPLGDESTLDSLRAAGFEEMPVRRQRATSSASALDRLQQHLFSREALQPGNLDESVVLFSAPGEGRECVEIARRVMEEAAQGRAIRPDRRGIAVAAILSRLSGARFPTCRGPFVVRAWHATSRSVRPRVSGTAGVRRRRTCRLVALPSTCHWDRYRQARSPLRIPGRRRATRSPNPSFLRTIERLIPIPRKKRERRLRSRSVVASSAGSLRAPWRWEELLVESAVMHGADRWERRLKGLREEYRLRLDELVSDEPESPRIPAIERDIEQLDHLREFALPIVTEMAGWPREPRWGWGRWLVTLGDLAPRVLRHPSRVLRILQELGPLSAVGPVSLREVREVLSTRLLTLTHDPPRRRHGRVFVGTPAAVRGRSFQVVFVPGLAERVFPQRLREDALLLDERRDLLNAPLPRQKQRADEERLQLRLAVGATSERAYLSWPRVELQESRQRVPSFYVLDVARAIEGRIPAYATVRDRAFVAGGATLAWPAPEHPERAIDEFEHDLSMLHGLLRDDDHARAKGPRTLSLRAQSRTCSAHSLDAGRGGSGAGIRLMA